MASKVTTIADTVGGTAVFTMGARADSLTQKLHGRLDDLRVYHRAMYGSEVSAIRHGMEALAANASSTSSTGYSNRLQSDGTYVYQYDNEGNLVRKSASYPIRETTFDWDHRNRLSWVTQYGPLETVQLRLNDSGATDVEDAIHTVEAGNFYGEASVVTVPSGLELPTGQTDALQLDGSGDYVSLGLQDELVVGTSDFSVSAWFYAANTSGLQTIVSQGLAYLDGYALSVTSTGNLEFRLRDGSASQTVTIVPGVSLAGDWHHVLISVDRDGDIVPYLDGVELTSQIVATQVGGYIDGSTMFPFTVGALAGMSEFEGYLGDVRLFHEALDASWAATVAAYATSTYALLSQTQQTYDHANRWIATEVDADGAGPGGWEKTYFVYDGQQIALQLNESGETTHRYLWGSAVDQLLADEQVSSPTQAGEVYWPLTDHLGTVRDLASFDPVSGTAVEVHRNYDSFGNLVSETNPNEIDHLFGFTGRPLDQSTGLQNNLHRWYDPGAGRWISEDPIGFAAGDANLYRYVGNSTDELD